MIPYNIVFGLEHRALRFPKDEEGLFRVRIDVRCAPAFIFGLNLAYTRLSHQGDPSLVRRSEQVLNQRLAASLSLTGVKRILHFAEVYGMRGVREEMERLICNDVYLENCRDQWTGRDIQRLVASKTAPAKIVEAGKGFEQFVAGLSLYERGIYLVHLEVMIRRRDQKAAQLAVYYASLKEITNQEVHREGNLV